MSAGASTGASGKDCAALFSTQVEAGQQWLARTGHNGMALPATPLQNPFPYAPGLPPPPAGCPPPARTPAPAPPTKRATSNPYVAFCREQRPFLPADLRNAEREQTLGMRMECVDMESHIECRSRQWYGALVSPAYLVVSRGASIACPGRQGHHTVRPLYE